MTSSNDAPLVNEDAVGGINPPTNPERHRFHFLDALRGIAAILVVMRHAPPAFAHALNAHHNFFAVDFFFCLSGFVIAFSYEKRLQGAMSFGSFTVSRMIRLWPIALLGTLLGAMELVLSRHIHGYAMPYVSAGTALTLLLLGLLILPYISIAHTGRVLFPLDGVMWTLFVEILANLFYATLLRFRLAGNWIVFSIASVSLIFLAIERWVYGTLDLGFRAAVINVALTRVGFSFFLGVLVYRFSRRLTPDKVYGVRAFSLAAVIVVTIVACLCDPIGRTYIPVVDLFIVCVIFPLIVYTGARVVLPRRWTAVCAFLGTISYPIYILHPPLLWFLTRDKYLQYASTHGSMAVVIMLAFSIFLILMAWVCAKFYDSPVRSMLTRHYRERFQTV